MTITKKLLGGIAFGAFLAGPALAADLPARVPVKAPPAVVTQYNWGGFYIGGHVGYGWGDTEWGFVNTPAAPTFTDFRLKGIVGGVHTGYNWQFDRWVLGIEGSVSATKMDGSTLCPNAAFRCEADVDHFWRAGVRAGMTAGATGNWLFYATGGFARAKLDTRTPVVATGANTASAGNHHHGWFGGAGIEWGVAPNFTVGIEAYHVSLGAERHFLPNGAVVPTFTRDVDLDFTVALARATYKFNWGAPVIARY